MILQSRVKGYELGVVARDFHDKISVLLGVFLRVTQVFGRHEVELHLDLYGRLNSRVKLFC